jgi:hypothetical protein
MVGGVRERPVCPRRGRQKTACRGSIVPSCAPLNLTVRLHVKRQRKRPAAPPKGAPRRRRPASAGVTVEQVRTVALAFPGVEDSTSYGTPALKVRGKLLARLHQSRECLVLRADFLDRQIMIQSAPGTFFITDHYRNYPWVLVRFSSVQARELPGLIERAWRLVAPKTLIEHYEAAR